MSKVFHPKACPHSSAKQVQNVVGADTKVKHKETAKGDQFKSVANRLHLNSEFAFQKQQVFLERFSKKDFIFFQTKLTKLFSLPGQTLGDLNCNIFLLFAESLKKFL
jgi:hypothetical protein